MGVIWTLLVVFIMAYAVVSQSLLGTNKRILVKYTLGESGSISSRNETHTCDLQFFFKYENSL